MKKFLALLLALVMTMSLVTVGASAKTAVTDDKEITEVEAVEVLSAMGIIDGYKDGSFKPLAKLTRGAGAKFVAYLMLGQKNADGLKATGTLFEDVAADYAQAPSIEWCAKMGIVDGYGNGNFGPKNDLTQAAFGKMLLTALGYDSAKEGYTGAGWQKAVYADGLNAGVYGDDGEIYAVCDRETAAKMALGALLADMVEYGKTVKVNNKALVSENGAVTVYGDKRDTSTNPQDGLQLWETYKDLKYSETGDNGKDAFGRPGHTWKYGKDFEKFYVDEAVLTYENQKVTAADLWTDLGMTETNTNPNKLAYAKKAAVKTVVDGKPNNLFTAVSGGKAELKAGKGSVVEVFAKTTDGVTEYTAVVVNTYVGTITDWQEAKLNKNDEIKDKEYVKVDGVKFETTDFTKDDKTDGTVVLYTKADDLIKSVVKAESVTGKLTKKVVTDNVGTITVEGKDYVASYTMENNKFDGMTVGTKYDLYFDTYGNVIKFVETVDETTFAVVLDSKKEAASTTKGSATYTVDLYYLDGTTETVTVKEATFESFNEKTELNRFVKVGEVDDDGYTALTAFGPKCKAPIEDDEPNYDGKYANNETVYLVDEGEGKITKYVGYKEVPALEDDGDKDTNSWVTYLTERDVKATTADPSKGYANLLSYVYVVGFDATDDSVTSYVWAQSNENTETDVKEAGKAAYTTYTYTKLYVDGEQKDFVSKVNGLFAKQGFYKVVTKGGKIQSADKVTPVYVGTTDKFPMYAVADIDYIDATTETIKLEGAAKAYKYDAADIDVYTTVSGDNKDEFKAITVADLEDLVKANTNVICLCDKDGVVTAIYVVKADVVNTEYAFNMVNKTGAHLTATKGTKAITVTAATGYTATGVKFTVVDDDTNAVLAAQDTTFAWNADWNAKNVTVTVEGSAVANTYTVAYYDVNGDLLGTDTVAYDQDYVIKAYPKEGYTLTGWTQYSDGTPTYTVGQPVKNLVANGVYDLKATWKENTYDVTIIYKTQVHYTDDPVEDATAQAAPLASYHKGMMGYEALHTFVNTASPAVNGTTIPAKPNNYTDGIKISVDGYGANGAAVTVTVTYVKNDTHPIVP